MTSSDNKIFNDTEHHVLSMQQVSFSLLTFSIIYVIFYF